MRKNLKRTLVDSRSLEVKCMFFFFIALTLALSVSFLLYYLATQRMVQEQNPLMANILAQQYISEKHWGIFGGQPAGDPSIALPTDIRPPDTLQADISQGMENITRRIRHREVNFSFVANREKIASIYLFDGYRSQEQRDLRSQNLREQHEKYAYAMKHFPIIPQDFSPENDAKFRERLDADGTYHYFEEVRNLGSKCSLCHKNFDVGELMGVMHVSIPRSSMRQTMQKYFAYILAAAIVSVFLALFAVSVVIRWLVIAPLRNLKAVTESISRGELQKRVNLQTGDEFETLAHAFNQMLGYIDTTQGKLREANMELESHVTELAYQTVRLYETNRIKSDFMATMSHELRTPLNSILGFSDVLGSISTLNDKQKKYVENINTSGKSLLHMINDILDMAKIEAGRVDVKPTTFSIAAVVAAQTDMAKPLVDKKNIKMSLEIEENLPPMQQEESRVQQILNNLLSNAIKFTPEGGRITVSVGRLAAVPTPRPDLPPPIAGAAKIQPPSRDMLKLEVIDTGVGISETDQLIIFEKFRQGASATAEGNTLTREHSGSGLGLSIVREICRMLDGDIAVKSQLGVGSTFTVTLPWTLESKTRMDSAITAEIHQFAHNRINMQRNDY